MRKREPIGDEPDGPGPDEVEGDYTQTPRKAKPSANVAIDNVVGSTTRVPDTRAAMNRDLMTNAPTPAPQARKAPAKAPASAPTTPKTDTWAGVRADLLANAKADAASKALAEKKRQEAEAFSASLKGATKRSSTGYDSYKSLMGE